MNADELSELILSILQGGVDTNWDGVSDKDGIIVSKHDEKMQDANIYEFHFTRWEKSILESRIATKYESLIDSFAYSGGGIDGNRPTFDQQKLSKLSNDMLNKLKAKGNYKLIAFGQNNYKIESI